MTYFLPFWNCGHEFEISALCETWEKAENELDYADAYGLNPRLVKSDLKHTARGSFWVPRAFTAEEMAQAVTKRLLA